MHYVLNSLRNRLLETIYSKVYKSTLKKITQLRVFETDILIFSNEDVGWRLLCGCFEREEIEHLIANLQPNDVILDVGANVGIISLILGKNGQNVHVHAFEPLLLNRTLISASLLLNKLENIVVNSCCVGASTGLTTFSEGVDSAYSSINDTKLTKATQKHEVPIITLDDYIASQKIHQTSILKIDVEGAESLVLIGAEKLLSDPALKPRLIMIELVDSHLSYYNSSIGDIVKLLESHNYSGYGFYHGKKRPFSKDLYGKITNVFFALPHV
jgi:FkbM family methyltransferase